MKQYRVEFPGSAFAPVSLDAGVKLSDALRKGKSPITFGCRDGLCAACVVTLTAEEPQRLAGPDEREQEVLAIFAPGNDNARLACQVHLTTNIQIQVDDA